MRALGVDEKLELLVGAACVEASSAELACSPGPDLTGAVFRAAAGGRRVPLLKVLLSNACQNDCAYCATRASARVRRCTLSPDQLARSFDDMRRSGLVQGLFLSSGLCGDSVRTMDRLLDTVEIVRGRYQFTGYVHLKVMPGATDDQVERAGLIADRISVNLEAPNPARLGRIAPDKDFGALLGLMDRMRALRARIPGFAPAGPTTQFVAGSAGESDRELLACADGLYRGYGLRRAYYSPFRPVPDSPLQDVPPMAPARERRLYQADALLREYGFSADEIPYDDQGDLESGMDPKLAWALRHPERFPVEVNTASRQALVRVPGIGPTGARRLLEARRHATIRDLTQLARLGMRAETCAPFVLLAGRRPPMQMPLPLSG
ncbi:MAG: radical SAM protein [Anaerolineae bacterium]|nr:radical SAM protein [Anaerolineae bacterium]